MPTIAFDTETRGLNWFDPEETAFLATWADARDTYVANLTTPDGVATYVRALDDATTIVAHNLSFDTHQTRATTGYDLLTQSKELHDTDTMSRIMHPEGQRKDNEGRGGHGLKNLAKVYLRADADADEAENVIGELAKTVGYRTLKTTGAYYDVWRAYPDQLEHYAREDARFTYDLYDRFSKEITEAQKQTYELERQVTPILIRAEQVGTAVDQEPLVPLVKQYTDQRDKCYEYLEKELGEQALGGEGSTEALIEALQAQGIPLHRKTDSGQLATNHFALQEFESDFPVIQQLFDFRRAKKFLTTYLEPMVGRDVVHPSFSQIGAWTGRMSCRRPNMQNIPLLAGSEVRSMFVPREGHSFVVCDYLAIEERLLAYYLADETYRELVNSRDSHAWLAAMIHGGAEADYHKGTPGERLRKEARNVKYAILYGAGGGRLTDMLQLDPGPFYEDDHPAVLAAQEQGRWWPKPGWQYKEGRALAKTVKDSLPGYNKLNKRIRKKIESVGHVNTLFGRVNPVKRDKSYVGLNALIQGSAADIMKQGLVLVNEAVEPLGGYPILVVHDEVVVEVPNENAEEALQLTKQVMTQAYDLDPPLNVDGSVVTTNYSDA